MRGSRAFLPVCAPDKTFLPRVELPSTAFIFNATARSDAGLFIQRSSHPPPGGFLFLGVRFAMSSRQCSKPTSNKRQCKAGVRLLNLGVITLSAAL